MGGVVALLVIGALGVTKYLGEEEKSAVYVLLSLVISCGWLAFSWVMFQGKKAYLNDLEEDEEEAGKLEN